MSKCITTYSKINFNPLQPHIEGICIDDIAHALSLVCRANGHFPVFYSVAQHSIYCCEEALARGYGDKVALACLLHDASEAYIADITRPVKPHLTNYLDIESHLQELIYSKYLSDLLTTEDRTKITIVDDLMLHHEFKSFMQHEIPAKDTVLYTSPNFQFMDFKSIEEKYKLLFYTLSSPAIIDAYSTL